MANTQGDSPAATGWMTRAAVADALGITGSKVRRLEGRLLHPRKGDDGFWRFDPDEVARARDNVSRRPSGAGGSAVPRARAAAPVDGALAALLFPLFARGVSFDEVIRQTEVAPAVVRALFWEWRQGYGAPTERRDGSAGAHETEPTEAAVADDEAFTAWETEVRQIEREQARIDRLAQRHLRHWTNHR